MKTIDETPDELHVAIAEFFPADQWDNAASISFLESGWDAFALNNSAALYGCGGFMGSNRDVEIVGERSVGYFQINSCNFPDWEWQRLYNARHNAGTAHMIWVDQGWSAWLFSARALGLA